MPEQHEIRWSKIDSSKESGFDDTDNSAEVALMSRIIVEVTSEGPGFESRNRRYMGIRVDLTEPAEIIKSAQDNFDNFNAYSRNLTGFNQLQKFLVELSALYRWAAEHNEKYSVDVVKNPELFAKLSEAFSDTRDRMIHDIRRDPLEFFEEALTRRVIEFESRIPKDRQWKR